MTELQKLLFENQDLKYKEFHSKLMPTVDTDTIIGVRVPTLRGIAKKFPFDEKKFMNEMPHK